MILHSIRQEGQNESIFFHAEADKNPDENGSLLMDSISHIISTCSGEDAAFGKVSTKSLESSLLHIESGKASWVVI